MRDVDPERAYEDAAVPLVRPIFSPRETGDSGPARALDARPRSPITLVCDIDDVPWVVNSSDFAGEAVTNGAPQDRARTFPNWLVDEASHPAPIDWEDPNLPPIRKYHGWIRILICVGGSVLLWGLIAWSARLLLQAVFHAART